MATTRNGRGSVSDETESLKLIVEEQKQDYSYLIHIYDRMRATEGVLLTVTFGILAYLYYSGPDGSVLTRLFIPTEDYGKVIYFMAAGFFAYGLIKLMMNVFGNNPWMTAYEAPKTDYQYKPAKVLQYVKNRYDKCLEFNGARYAARKRELTFLFYCILISATILIVIKTLN